MQYSHIVVYITVPSKQVGQDIAKKLVESNLAACVNLIPGVLSIYQWHGDIEQDDEILLMAKSKPTLFDQLVVKVKNLHPYDVPEIIALPIVSGSGEYLAWINEVTINK